MEAVARAPSTITDISVILRPYLSEAIPASAAPARKPRKKIEFETCRIHALSQKSPRSLRTDSCGCVHSHCDVRSRQNWSVGSSALKAEVHATSVGSVHRHRCALTGSLPAYSELVSWMSECRCVESGKVESTETLNCWRFQQRVRSERNFATDTYATTCNAYVALIPTWMQQQQRHFQRERGAPEMMTVPRASQRTTLIASCRDVNLALQ